jgi:hypothetical protein
MKCVHLLPADVKAEVENRDENIRGEKKRVSLQDV